MGESSSTILAYHTAEFMALATLMGRQIITLQRLSCNERIHYMTFTSLLKVTNTKSVKCSLTSHIFNTSHVHICSRNKTHSCIISSTSPTTLESHVQSSSRTVFDARILSSSSTHTHSHTLTSIESALLPVSFSFSCCM